jgi:hypothetical protein
MNDRIQGFQRASAVILAVAVMAVLTPPPAQGQDVDAGDFISAIGRCVELLGAIGELRPCKALRDCRQSCRDEKQACTDACRAMFGRGRDFWECRRDCRQARRDCRQTCREMFLTEECREARRSFGLALAKDLVECALGLADLASPGEEEASDAAREPLTQGDCPTPSEDTNQTEATQAPAPLPPGAAHVTPDPVRAK